MGRIGIFSADSCSSEDQCHLPDDGVCLAIILQPEHAKELAVRVAHILHHQHFHFAHVYLAIDTHGAPVPKPLAAHAEKLVQSQKLHHWFAVNYTKQYVTATNGTANFDPEEHPPDKGWKERHRSVDHMEFNQDYEEEVQMAHYFVIDKCKQRYLAIINLEVLWMTQNNFSWIQAGLELLRRNDGLVLVMPAFPGVELRNLRKIRSRPWTKRIEKTYKKLESSESSIEAEDTTCDHPYTLPGWVNLLDLQRYQKLGPRQKVKEHRCGGQLVKGKKCTSFEYIRGCGGMRHWEYALECVICNRPDLRQAHLTNWHLAWAQKAPLLCFRSEVAEMVAGMEAVQNGSMIPAMGMNFVANWTTN